MEYLHSQFDVCPRSIEHLAVPGYGGLSPCSSYRSILGGQSLLPHIPRIEAHILDKQQLRSGTSSYQEPTGIKPQPAAHSICFSPLLVVVVPAGLLLSAETKPDELILGNP